MKKEKRTQFFNELYTGERAEYKPTSVRLPAGLLEDLAAIAEKTGKTQSSLLQYFIYKGLCEEYGKERGDLVLTVSNPQRVKPATEETRAEMLKILADIAALKIDKRAGFNTGVNDLINYHFEKLCKENKGGSYQKPVHIETPAETLARAKEEEQKKQLEKKELEELKEKYLDK